MAGARLLVLEAVALVTACGAVESVFVDGFKHVVKCELDARHVEPSAVYIDQRGAEVWVSMADAHLAAVINLTPLRIESGTPHRMVIEWSDEPEHDGVCPFEDCPKPVDPGDADCGSHERWMT